MEENKQTAECQIRTLYLKDNIYFIEVMIESVF